MLLKVGAAALCLAMVVSTAAFGQDELFLHWSFNDEKDLTFRYGEDVPEETTVESVSGTDFRLNGLSKYVPGVTGTALKFDGFSSQVQGLPEGKDGEDFAMPRDITIEGWIAIGSYPWNWSPILTLGKYKVTGFYFGIDSRGRLGFHMSDATSVWHECNSEVDSKTHLGLDIQKWYHVAATYSPETGSTIYINGEKAGTYTDFTFDYGIAYSSVENGFLMGRNFEDLAPTEPIRDWATYPLALFL